MASTDDHLTERDLDDIQRRCDAATSGPWRAFYEGRDHTGGSSLLHTSSGDGFEMLGATEADHDFVANAKQDVSRLVEEVRRLRARLGKQWRR